MARPRVTGYPTSSNRASSMHLRWALPPGVDAATAASITLTVEVPPVVDELYFWALQGSFTDEAGRRHGGGHVGLQWHPHHPGHKAVNWGGYGPDGAVLPGSASPLPSATGNANTRDLNWRVGLPHRLRIERAADGWAGSIDGLVVRTLHAGGDRLHGLVVWSEVFARCDHPATTVRWSDPEITTGDGRSVVPAACTVSYQSRADGGCDNTTVEAGPDGIRQITGVGRAVAAGSAVAWPS